MIGPLTNPGAHGGDPADAFHLVLPSIPGYGFSGPTLEPGWDVPRIARAWDELMTRLGYERYGAQGGDWGAMISRELGISAADRVIGVHLNMLSPQGPLDEPDLSDEERRRLDRMREFRNTGLGYGAIQSTRPQTLAYALTDSPAGQLAWIVEKFKEWTDPDHELPEDAVDLDQLLTNVSIYWFTEGGASAAHSVYEGMQAFREFASRSAEPTEGWEAPTPPPVGVAVFAADMSVRRDVDPYGMYTSWHEYDAGGHFPAMEVPELLVDDIRAFFRLVR